MDAISTWYNNVNVDRNLGSYISSKNFSVTTINTNTYNVTLYASANQMKKFNSGYVVYSEGTTTLFNIWGATGIGKKLMVNQDMITHHVKAVSGDCFSTSAINTAVKQDNTTGITGCQNDVSLISSGKGIVSQDLYYYTHISRDLTTSDTSCDSAITNGIQLCAVYKGLSSTGTDFGEVHDGVLC